MSSRLSYEVAVIGTGKMGGAVLNGLLHSGKYVPECLLAVDLDCTKLAGWKDLGVRTADSVAEAAKASAIIIAVKPNHVPGVLQRLREVNCSRSTVISVAAGVPLSVLEDLLPGIPVIRTMPNTPAMVGKAVTAISSGSLARPDGEPAVSIFGTIGTTVVVKEEYLNAVTGLSGSGPAYCAVFLEALIEGGVAAGLPRDTASQLALQTMLGTAELIIQTSNSPSNVRAAVTSPGGTTAQGLRVLEKGAFRSLLIEAVCAASARSRELARQPDSQKG